MKAFLVILLMSGVARATGQPGFELNESRNSYIDETDLVGDRMPRRSISDNTERTLQLSSPSDLSWQLLANKLHLNTEDLDLSYETIWYRGQEERRTITIKRAKKQNNDGKTRQQRQSGSVVPDRPDINQGFRAKRVIIGVDERKKLPSSSKAQKAPYAAACKVTCRGFCSWSCSGILIGSRHVLTSAHCLDGVTAGTLQAGFLERNGRLQWYDVVKAYIPLRWKTSKALANDYAVLKLNRPPNRSYVSVSSVALPKGSVISITGFPGDKAPSSLWTTKCRALMVTSGLIWNQCDAARGSSGSGVFLKDNSRSPRTTVVGVLSGEKVITHKAKGQKVRLNVAVHLTRTRVSQIHEWTRD